MATIRECLWFCSWIKSCYWGGIGVIWKSRVNSMLDCWWITIRLPEKKTNRSTWLRVPGRARNRPLRFILKYFHIQNDLDWNWEKYLYSNMAFLAFNQNSTSKIVFEILTRSFMSSLESQNVNVSSAIILRLPIIKVSSEWLPILADLIWKDKKRDPMQRNYASITKSIRVDQILTITSYSAMPEIFKWINKCFKSSFTMLIAKLICAKANHFAKFCFS